MSFPSGPRKRRPGCCSSIPTWRMFFTQPSTSSMPGGSPNPILCCIMLCCATSAISCRQQIDPQGFSSIAAARASRCRAGPHLTLRHPSLMLCQITPATSCKAVEQASQLCWTELKLSRNTVGNVSTPLYDIRQSDAFDICVLPQ